MTGRERMIRAFEHREGDRVPLYEQAFASDVATAVFGRPMLTGGTSLHFEEAKAWMRGDAAHEEFSEKVWADLESLTEYFDFDAVNTPWRMTARPTRRPDEYTFVYGEPGSADWWAVYRYDPASTFFSEIDSRDRYVDVDEIPGIVGAMEREFAARRPLSSDAFPQLGRLAAIAGGTRCVLGGSGIGIPRTPAWLEAAVLHPEAVGRFLDIGADAAIEGIELNARAGISVIWGGGDFAGRNGPFYSPSVFRTLMLPRVKRIADACRRLGVHYLFRSDGDLRPVAEMLFRESGIHGYGEIEVGAGMELEWLKREYGHLTFWGNLSCDLLRTGSVGQVRDAVKRCVDDAAAGGGYVFGTSNAVLPGTPPENVVAMYETARTYGRYR